ncbi:AAA family ATPase [Enterococcus casseliflavus]|uniref:AAA family ATPase n=1 Tax=Enterococcus casseliflavus TaxID=37734 RepID=UPI0035D9A42B
MDSLELKNLRAIQNSGELELNNLNLFLGANSTGKSTILRFFPLIRQTLARNNNSPILWYDSEGVDFGSFKESVYSEDESKDISFKFTFKDMDIAFSSDILLGALRAHLKKRDKSSLSSNYFFYISFDNIEKENIMKSIAFEVAINKDEYTKIEVSLNSKTIEFDLKNSTININGKTIASDISFVVNTNSPKIIPELYYEPKDSDKKRYPLEKLIGEKLMSSMLEKTNPKISIEALYRFVTSLKYYENRETFEEKSLSGVSQKTIQHTFKNNIESIYDYFTIFNILCIIKETNSNLSRFFENISYIAPVRATAERYYRIQGLSVFDVDSMGSNVPMILNSMSSKDRTEWQKWTKENFNIEFETKKSMGHSAIQVKATNGEKHNLADTGFGFSQILPVLLTVWKRLTRKQPDSSANYPYRHSHEYRKNDNKYESLIIIEQPELHLHPAMQAQLADMLIKIIIEHPTIRFIIETHSVVIMNRIGQHIEKDNANIKNHKLEEKINVFLVNPSETGKKNVTFTSFDKEGIIQEWPVGFLSGGIL